MKRFYLAIVIALAAVLFAPQAKAGFATGYLMGSMLNSGDTIVKKIVPNGAPCLMQATGWNHWYDRRNARPQQLMVINLAMIKSMTAEPGLPPSGGGCEDEHPAMPPATKLDMIDDSYYFIAEPVGKVLETLKACQGGAK